jgi:hypothetical protein
MRKCCLEIGFVFLLVALLNVARAAPLAEFTGTSSNYMGFFVNWATARQFTLTSDADITELHICIGVWFGETSTDLLYLELRRDNNDRPISTYVIQLSKMIKDLPQWDANWVRFPLVSSQHLDAGNYWIVLRSNRTDPNIDFFWAGQPGNPYGRWVDAMSSEDNGVTWPILQGFDPTFKVFGTRTAMNTTTVLTLTPSGSVARSGVVNVQVAVNDSLGQPVQGGGSVALTANDGSWRNLSLDLVNGQASTKWTAPNTAPTSSTITAQLVAYSYGDYTYQSSSDAESISTYATNSVTNTTITISPSPTTTHNSCSVTANVTSGGNPVNGGKVTFSATGGKPPTSVAPVIAGAASMTWSTPLTDVGTFMIAGSFSGYDPGAGPNVYGPSTGTKTVDVSYTTVPVTLSLEAAPDRPYINGRSFLVVEVTETATGDPVPDGPILLNCFGSGSFTNPTPSVIGGRAHGEWHAPNSVGLVTIRADYPPHIANGYLYRNAFNTDQVTVVVDPDGATLKVFGEYIEDFPGTEKDLTDGRQMTTEFRDRLVATGYFTAGHLHGNSGASPDHFESEGFPYYGSNNSHGDDHDIGLISSHGSADYLWLYNSGDWLADNEFHHYEASRALGNKDLEWVGFHACLTMSHASDWANVMDHLHGICGFSTLSQSAPGAGKIWANLMIKDGPYDLAHTISQAWFLTADMTSQYDRVSGERRTAKVISEDANGLDDYLWGNGPVEADPAVDNTYHHISHTYRGNRSPVAWCTGNLNATAGVPFSLDATGSRDADRDYITYIWDMDTATNTDHYDYDGDGTDDADDDGNVSGRTPTYVYTSAGVYGCRLIVVDDLGAVDAATFWVTVAAPAPPGPKQDASPAVRGGQKQNPGTIRIQVNPTSMPTETLMDRYVVTEQEVSYAQIQQIASYYGFAADALELDDLSNWTMHKGSREIVVNRYSGAIMSNDLTTLYRWNGSPIPPVLPNDAQTTAAAAAYLNAFGMNTIPPSEIVYEGIQDYFYGQVNKETTSRPIPVTFPTVQFQFPFERQVVYRRQLPSTAGGQPAKFYPVVGPGGKLYVTINRFQDCDGFMKVWRRALPSGVVSLTSPVTALNKFQQLGLRAAVDELQLPNFNELIIKDMSLSYYEAGFVTPQSVIEPVYTLEGIAVDDHGSVNVQIHVPAGHAPVEARIETPPDLAYFALGDNVDLRATATGGVPPYSYLWQSDVNGNLGTGSSVTVSTLSVFRLDDPTSRIVPHTIKVEVTDSEGRRGFDLRKIVISDLFEVWGLTAVPGDRKVDLSWVNPLHPRFAAVRIQRKVGGYPLSPLDGTTAYQGTAEVCSDTSLTNGVTYYYRAFAKDTGGSYSAGIRASARPRAGPTGIRGWQFYR